MKERNLKENDGMKTEDEKLKDEGECRRVLHSEKDLEVVID